MSLPSSKTPAREYAKGIGDAVADRTINRKVTRAVEPYTMHIELPRRDDMALDHEVDEWCKSNNYVIESYAVDYGDELIVKITLNVIGIVEIEKWEDVAHRVAFGNSLLHPQLGDEPFEVTAENRAQEFEKMNHHLRQASILMSGRHLQHGDETQPSRPMEVFTNCSTSASTFLTFYLLLNGSGVGRSYDNEMIVADLNNLPIVVPVVDMMHKDAQSGEISALDLRTAKHLYAGRTQEVFEVPDSREGWAKALEKMELMAFEGDKRDTVLILDFSKVRPRGTGIAGMQGRPASGPGPLMTAISNVAKLRDAGMAPWRAAMYADHYVAECVLVGGARRAARMATKTWRDKDCLDFVQVKRGGFLWSSNNSVTCDDEFWGYVKGEAAPRGKETLAAHAKAVFDALTEAAYYDQTGEPGIINVDKLTWKDDGIETLLDGDFAESARYKLDRETLKLTSALANAWKNSKYKVITNPCGEIVLGALGGYCVIADVVPFHAASYEPGEEKPLNSVWDADAEDSFRTATRALIRTNLMDSMYHKEVHRTNRIGVGITGLHEYAWARFGYGWRDIVNEELSKDFWLMLARFKRAVQEEARSYSELVGVAVPHTNTTIKPAGTTSKLFGLTEGAHLASMREYLRWVQFRNDDPLIDNYRALGYPIRMLKTYSGTTIVGFPTRPQICALGMGDKLVTAAEATPEEQYQYLRLLEKYWITGVQEDGVTPLEERGNQVSYTLKYDPTVVSFEDFKRTLMEGQSTIRCCSVMPQADTSAYEYQPEQPVNAHEYEMICAAIKDTENVKQDIGAEHVDCSTGACPIDFGTNEASK
jgi:adenosylcobalamin-dependent ribonucleoside-triphosphate reductase